MGQQVGVLEALAAAKDALAAEKTELEQRVAALQGEKEAAGREQARLAFDLEQAQKARLVAETAGQSSA